MMLSNCPNRDDGKLLYVGARIENLVDHPQFGGVLATWHVREWGHLYRQSVWNETIARHEFATMKRDLIPITLLALDDSSGELMGSVSLIADDDLEGFAQLSPWLASLFVVPPARGNGVARELMNAILLEAHRLGHPYTYLFTSGQEEYYRRHGWSFVAMTQTRGHNAAVMARSTSPHGARRGLVTQWTSNPHFLGTYSHLKPGGTPTDRDTLQRPVHGSLWFAGEAMSTDYPGTLHGAWFSGERAATELHAVKSNAAVVVIGAGMAGLAAATQLVRFGHSVVVLEAEPEIGGRARTDRSLGVPVHVGGTWMHGTEGHPVEAFGLRSLATDFSRTPVLVPNGPRFLEATIIAALEPIEAALGEAGTHTPSESYTSAMAHLSDLVASVTEECAAAHAVDVTHVASAIRTVLRGTYENLYCALPNQLSLPYRAEPYSLPGDDSMIVEPLDTFLQPIANALDLRLSTEVRAVRSSGERWIIETADATLNCDAVIITTPIGVLQTNQLMFDPPLPPTFTDALHRLGPGAVAKAFFTFDEKFWTESLWYVSTEAPLIFDLWVDVSKLTNVPTLCAFAAASVAHAAEAMSEFELCVEADRSLALVFGRI
jgi:polyamine oxidase